MKFIKEQVMTYAVFFTLILAAICMYFNYHGIFFYAVLLLLFVMVIYKLYLDMRSQLPKPYKVVRIVLSILMILVIFYELLQ
ncbi:hypothetical protein A4S06_09275 [Erysipelotrichaceae bacterium MTC7]|nr:hypothetical protein A4S06_09275 [Erysipelotrichaceae bacterium MTC7]